MRTGACTVQQALTAEAASVLKLSLTLAKRRGHAQVTPLHVAATLLSSSSSSSNLLRRACLKSHPHHPASHPLRCRALELCFNVALNRLPTTPPPSSSGSLIHSQPPLSNALTAALKRAQAHQRRGCIELQQQQPQQQQQPLLAIKVELEQLIISILDDPSVSRVMREAGFSSTSVKNNLEEETSVLLQSSPPFYFESHKDILSQGSFWQSQFLKPPSELNPLVPSSQKEDLRVVLEVMVRKQGRRSNTVVVGDSVSMTEGLVSELMGRVERGEVPDELKSAHFIKLHLSYVHLRLMSKGDVDMKVDDLRRKICSLASDSVGEGVIIYAGDLRWAVDEETKDGQGFRPVDHMIGEIGRLLSELRSSNGHGGGGGIINNNKVWLLATASYQTYMRCQMRQPSLETEWALQAVVVPSGGLALSLQAPSGLDSRMTKLSQYPFQMLELKAFNYKDEEEKLSCCAECASNFEKEASVFKSESASSHLPIWLRPHRPDNHHKDALPELRRKWNRLCQSLCHGKHSQAHPYHPLLTPGPVGKSCTHASSHPWWSSSLAHNQEFTIEPHSMSITEAAPKVNGGSTSFASQIKNGTGKWQERDAPMHWPSAASLPFVKKPANQEVKTTLALGNPLFSDSATSKDQRRGAIADPQDLSRQLEENIPWQAGAIPSIVEALHDCRSSEKRGTWLLIRGTDDIAKRRVARVIAEIFCGSTERLVHMNTSKLVSGASWWCTEILTEACKKDQKCAVLIEDIDRAHPNIINWIAEGLKKGFLEDAMGSEVGPGHGVFILTTSSSTKFGNANENPEGGVMKMKLWVEETERETPLDLKRRPEREYLAYKSKKSRSEENSTTLDLNLRAVEEEEEEEDAVPSDLTHETDGGDPNLPYEILESSTACLTMDASPERSCWMLENLLSKLHRAFEEVMSGGEGMGQLCVDQTAVEELMIASGSFLESLFDKWVREVFQMSLVTVKKGGKVRLGVEGKEGNVRELGFQGSVLPNMIHVG